MIESLEAVVSAGPGGGVDESARRVAAKSPVECRRGGAKGGGAKSHGALVRRVRCRVRRLLYCRVGAGFCRARVALYERGK